ncbi:hypothetical protein MMC11_004654 [Xylographa trunciseda]|nr:hypothetical protein [Xylographa trunciseda]
MTELSATEVPRSLVRDYEALFEELQLLDRDLLERGATRDAVFINNMILRLKLWAADIDVAGGALNSAEKIGPLAIQIRMRLEDLKAQCGHFRFPLDRAEVTMTDHRQQFTQSMDSLSAFSEPLKTARTSSTNEADPIPKISAHLRQSSFYRNTHGGWYLVREPLARRFEGFPLGSVVANADDPMLHYIPYNQDMSRVSSTTSKDFTLQGGSSKARSSRLASLLEIGARLDAGGNSSSDEVNTVKIRTRALVNEEGTFNYHLKTHHTKIMDVMANSPDWKALFVVGTMSASNLDMNFNKSVSRSVQATVPGAGIVAASTGIRGTLPDLQAGFLNEITEGSSTTYNNEGWVVFALRYRVIKAKRFGVHLGEQLGSEGSTQGMFF